MTAPIHQLAMLWYGRVERGDVIRIPGESGLWVVRKVKEQGDGFHAILLVPQP